MSNQSKEVLGCMNQRFDCIQESSLASTSGPTCLAQALRSVKVFTSSRASDY